MRKFCIFQPLHLKVKISYRLRQLVVMGAVGTVYTIYYRFGNEWSVR